MVEHATLAAKLRKDFDRLQITDEATRNSLTTELNRLAIFLIETYSENQVETKM